MLPKEKRAPVVFLGFETKDIEGRWAREGVRPMHHHVTEALLLAKSMSLDVSLHGGLTYFAVLDTDEDQLPSVGELTSAPVAVSEDTSEPAGTFVVESGWGSVTTAPLPQAPDDAPLADSDVELVVRTLRVDTQIRPPFLKQGRILVVGMPSSAGAQYVGPLNRATTSVWASENVELEWPVQVTAEVPANGGDLLVLLDLDGGLQPSVGDLASKPLIGFVVPAEGETMDVMLQGPLIEDGEGGDSGDEDAEELAP